MCQGSANATFTVSHTTTANNLSYWYIITDDNDNILGWSTTSTVDLSGAPTGTCRIWGWSYRGLPDPVLGNNISTLNDDPCEEISSNFITVYRENPDGGTVSSPNGSSFGVCQGSANASFTVSHTTTATNLSYWYIITDDNNNILDWSTSNTINLSGAPAGICRVWGWSYRGLPDPVVGNNISTLNDDACEEISSNFITVYRENPDGGTVSSPNGTAFGVCQGSANATFTVSHTTTATNLSYWYIITDANDNILDWSTSNTIDLSGAPAGICRVWGWSYRGLPDPVLGNNISTLTDDACEEISSNFIEVFRENPDGGTVSSPNGTAFGVCQGSANASFTVSHTTTAQNLSYWYIITDDNDNILGWSTTSTVDLSGAPTGTCRIWGWSYRGLPDPVLGNNISTLNDDPCEEISSNFITVYRENPDGGTVSSPNGSSFGVCQGSTNASFTVSHTTTATNLSYWYIITDDNNTILDWSTSNTIDLSGAPAGTCRVWGWSYRGLPDPIIGDNISTLNDDACEEISSNFIEVFRENPDGGMVSSPNGNSFGVCQGSANATFTVSHTTTATNLSYWYIITDDNDNILDWSTTPNIDLSGAPAGTCRVWGWSYRGLPDPVLGNNISTLNDDPCEEISSNFIEVIRETPDGGTVSSPNGTAFGVCQGSMNATFTVSHTTTANNLSYWYIITDDNDNILGWSTTSTVDLSGAPAGTCRIWGWSYRGLPDPVLGNNISTLNDDACEEISSNFITVYRENPDGGTVSSPNGTAFGVCQGSANASFTVSHTTTATNLSYWYIITDDNNNILDWSTSNTIDLSGAPAGTCRVWGWSYRGLPDPIIGDNISTLNDDACEEISSNFIEVFRENPDGGTVSSPNGSSFGVCQGSANATFTVSHTTTATNLSYWYIITDANDNILDWSTSNIIDLSGAPAGTCRVWGWSYRGLPDPIVGDNISTLNDDACEEISSNFIEVFRENPDGGTVSSPNGTAFGVCQGSANASFTVSHTTTAQNLSYWYIITDDNDNILGWSTTSTVDLSGAPTGTCRIWGWSYRGLPDPVLGNNISTLNDDPCEEISSNFITVYRENPDGGTVSSPNGSSFGVCQGSANATFTVSHTTTATNLSYWYIITDDNNNILDWSTSNIIDLSGAPAGTCRVWGWSYRGLPDPVVGDNISTLNDDACEELSSNFIEVFRENPDGGMVSSPNGSSFGVCQGSANATFTVSHTTTATNLSYWYIITDANDNILDWSTSNTIDLSGAPAGTCRVWGWSYRGLPDPIVGDNISTLNDDTCEEISSNFIEVHRENPDGGMVSSLNGSSFGVCQGSMNATFTVSHTTTATNLSYWYIITDDNDNILGWSTNDTIDLSGAPTGICRIWGWSYRGLSDPILGNNISSLNDDPCEDISSNFIEVFRENPDGGMVSSPNGTSFGVCQGGANATFTVSHTTTANNLSYWYIITDDSNNILDWSTNDTIDLSGAPAGICRVWGWSYRGLPDPIVGDNISTLNDDPCEDISSNFIEVARLVEEGGILSTNVDSLTFCIDDNLTDTLSLNTTGFGDNYVYFITDTLDSLLIGPLAGPVLNLEGFDDGVYRIYGVAYGNTLMTGSFISDLTADCVDVSDNFIEFTKVSGGDCVTSTTRVEPVSRFNVFPNPATNQVNVSYEDLINGRGQLELVSITGQVLHTRSLNVINDTIQLDISNFPNGVYFIRLQNTEGFSIKKLIIAN